jgi:hypothetical protein
MNRFFCHAGPLFVAVILLFGDFATLHAQNDLSARFPEVAQVTADFPDDAQRSAAFSVLYDAYQRAAPKPVARADYEKMMVYSGTSNAILSAHMANGAMQNGEYRAFNTRFSQFIDDANFRRSVLEKYQIANMASHPRPPPADAVPQQPQSTAAPPYHPQPASPPPATYQSAASQPQPFQIRRPPLAMGGDIFDLLPWAIGFSLPCLIPMAIAAWLVLRRSGVGRKIYPTPEPMAGGLPPLPKPLQVVSLPNVRFATYVLSGLVLNVRGEIHRSTVTTTTPTVVTTNEHGQTTTTPGMTTHHTTSTHETILYVRRPNGLEASWSIYDSAFECRPGNIVSVLVKPRKDGTGDILLAFNHAMGHAFRTREIENALSPRGNELGQWAANLAGAAAAWETMKLFLSSRDEKGDLDPGFIVPWLFICLILVTISFMVVTPWVKSRIFKSRNGTFNRRYFPGYLNFFAQGTPILQRTFGR